MKQPQVQSVERVIRRKLLEWWVRKRHNITGSLPRSADITREVSEGIVRLNVEVEEYGVIQDAGVRASRIPFSGTHGRGGKSLYIEGLMRYVEARMGHTFGSRENKGAAFAIAHKQKRYGMRIRERGGGSKWLQGAIKEIEPLAEQILTSEYAKIFEGEIERVTQKYSDQ